MKQPREMKPSTNLVAEVARPQAEESMGSDMKEALHQLREELRAEIKKVEDATHQLNLRADSHESHRQEVARLAEEIIQHIEVLRSPKLSLVTNQVQAIQAEHKQMLGTMNTLTGHCNEQFERFRSDLQSLASCNEKFAIVTHDNLSRIKDQMYTQNPDMNDVSVKTLANDAQDVLSSLAAQGHPHNDIAKLHTDLCGCADFTNKHDKQTSDIDEQLSQNTDECTSDQLEQIRCQMRAISANLWELRNHGAATKESVDNKVAELLSESRQHRAATKDHVDERISELHLILSQIKGEQEAKHLSKINEEYITDQFDGLMGAPEEVELSDHGDGLKVVIERTNEQVCHMKKEMQEMRMQLHDSRSSSEIVTSKDLEAIKKANKGYVDQKTSELRSNLSQIKCIAEMTLQELQKHTSATQEHVDKQVSAIQARLSAIANEHANGQILEEKNFDSPERCARVKLI